MNEINCWICRETIGYTPEIKSITLISCNTCFSPNKVKEQNKTKKEEHSVEYEEECIDC